MFVKNLIKRLTLVFAASVVALYSFAFTPMWASADQVESAEVSVEEEVNYPISYLVKVDENTRVAITLTDDTNATVTTFENNAFKDEIQANYTIDEEVITVVVNGEIYGVYDVSVKKEETPAPEVETPSIDAEEPAPEVNKDMIPETESSTWFEEKIEPLLWNYGMNVAALATICVIVLKKVKRTADSVGAVAGLLTKSNNDNEATKSDVKQLQKSNEAWQQEMEDKFNKKVEEMKSELVETEKDTNKTVHKLLNVEEIAYKGNPSFISKGIAKKISEVIHNDETKI